MFSTDIGDILHIVLNFTFLLINLSVLVAILNTKRVTHAIHYFVLSLVTADSLFVLFSLPGKFVEAYFGHWPETKRKWCALLTVLCIAFCTISRYQLVVISAYRLLCVTHPYVIRNLVKKWPIIVMVCITWISSSALCTWPLIYGFSLVLTSKTCQFLPDPWLTMYFIIVGIGFPFIAIILINCVIFLKLKSNELPSLNASLRILPHPNMGNGVLGKPNANLCTLCQYD